MSFQSEAQREAFNELVSATRWDIVNTLTKSDWHYTIIGLVERTGAPEVAVRSALRNLKATGRIYSYFNNETGKTFYAWSDHDLP